MADVTQAMGLSPSSIYPAFADKPARLARVLDFSDTYFQSHLYRRESSVFRASRTI
jgi:AcrR family transcriptional regulator